MIITWPSNTGEIITEIRNAIGRTVTFYVPASAMPCPDCTLDPVTNTSTDSFCHTCEGLYWIPVISGVDINAHVSWGKSDQMRWETGGQWYEGSCGIQIEDTPSNIHVVEEATSVLVDGKIMEIRKTMMRGFQPLNRLLVDLIEKER